MPPTGATRRAPAARQCGSWVLSIPSRPRAWKRPDPVKVSIPDTIQGIRQGLHLLEVHVPVAEADRTIRVETKGPLEPLDTQGGPAGGTYTIHAGIERLHVPLRVTQDGAGEAEVLVRCTAGPEADSESAHTITLTAPPAATAGSRGGRGTRLALTGLLLAGLAVGGVVLAPRLLGGAKVPAVVAQSEQEAVSALQAQNYVVERTYRDVEDPAQIGQVLETRPAGGERLDEGAKVVLVLGRAATKPAVPNVLGTREADARAALEAEGLRADVRYVQPTASDEIGRVVRQVPAASTQVDAGAGVVLRVARADAPPVEGGPDSTHTPTAPPGPGPDVIAEGPGDEPLPIPTTPEVGTPAPSDPDAPLEPPTEVRVPGGGESPTIEGPTASGEGTTSPEDTSPEDTGSPGSTVPEGGTPEGGEPGDTPTEVERPDGIPRDPILDGPTGLPPGGTPGEAPGVASPDSQPDPNDGRVEVPDLAGEAEAEATRVLDELGLFAIASFEPAATEDQVGRVMGQTPAAGERTDRSSSVTLQIGMKVPTTRPADGDASTTPTPAPGEGEPEGPGEDGTGPTPAARVSMPALIGFELADARQALEALGLRLVVDEEPTGDVPAGQILSQDPSAGAPLAEGGEVRLVVAAAPRGNGGAGEEAPLAPTPAPDDGGPASPPPARERVAVPGVIGDLADEAATRIREAGLDVNIRRVEEGDDLYAGRVVDQNPPEGQSVNRGSLVELRVYVPRGPVGPDTLPGDTPTDANPGGDDEPIVPTPRDDGDEGDMGAPPSRPEGPDFGNGGAGRVDGTIGPRAPSGFEDEVPDLGTPPSLAPPGTTGHRVAPDKAPAPRVEFANAQATVPPVESQSIWDAVDGVLRAGLTPVVELDLKDLQFLDRVARQAPAASSPARTGDLVRLKTGMAGVRPDERLYDMRSFLGAPVESVKGVYERAGIRVLVLPLRVPNHPYAGTGRVAAQYPLGRVPVSRAQTVTLWQVTK